MGSSNIRFIPTVLMLVACLLIANIQTTLAIRHLLQTSRSSSSSSFKGSLPSLSSTISPVSPNAPSNLPSKRTLPPLSSTVSALSPQASNLPSLPQGSLPPLSSTISSISPQASKVPSLFQGSLPRLPCIPTTPPAIRRVARPPPMATSFPTRPHIIRAVPTARPTLPALFPPHACHRP